jgi:hypothetical protein
MGEKMIDKTVKRRLQDLEHSVNGESGSVFHIRIVYVSPKWVEDDYETRNQRERINASTAAGQS